MSCMWLFDTVLIFIHTDDLLTSTDNFELSKVICVAGYSDMHAKTLLLISQQFRNRKALLRLAIILAHYTILWILKLVCFIS